VYTHARAGITPGPRLSIKSTCVTPLHSGLGYRAKFIKETAQKLQGLGREEWLLGLRQKGRAEVQVGRRAEGGETRRLAQP